MEFVRGIHNLKSHHRGCVLAIGNFDGFHRGHQSLIVKLQKLGCDRGLPVMVMVFEPHPRERFLKSVRLSNFRDKFNCFYDSGIDILLCVLFDVKFSLLDPRSFVSDILVDRLDIRVICVGDDFRFGVRRQGDLSILKKMSVDFGFEILRVNTYMDDSGIAISSTAIRHALKTGKLVRAEKMLGRPYSISGRVIYGSQVGSVIGFPTLNISVKGGYLPISGVYAVKVFGISSKALLGVANVGTCPTLHRLSRKRLEVHVLDQKIDIYGYYVQVIICLKIRDEQCFLSLKDLKTQIESDIQVTKAYFYNV